ncbi:MAG: hypothetical protein Hyperionvirus6_48 [Hyperionvirus sp.]|uniref:Uncharacterized protein n=1 Tax=Hyperionvirus sp. TaxID=2487770 RepID=A0A3G5A7Y8_9VIRU|nr:MAG: hypothetical protein Hyperionvirus6_48 [Hyperionvirus sp.]
MSLPNTQVVEPTFREYEGVRYYDKIERLGGEIIAKYYEKLGVFKRFYPTYWNIGNNISCEYELGKYIDESADNYDAVCKAAMTRVYVGDKILLANIRTQGYLFGFKESEKLDSLDMKFMKDQLGYEKMELFGLHTYGGYYGMFRPDIDEVIHLLNRVVSLEDLSAIERIYVTTEPHPSDKGRDAYDVTADKHRAKTTCYIVKTETKQVKQTRRKDTSTDESPNETDISETTNKKRKKD